MATTTPVTPFVMHSSRDALAAGLVHIEEQVRGIEQAVVENPALAFDLARTLIESVCKTILTERKIPYSNDTGLPSLFRTVRDHLPFLPPAASAEAEVRGSLDKTLNGLHSAIQGICELRNRCCFASHGSDRALPAMESAQALLAAQAADTIVGFLYRIHSQDRTPTSARALYEEKPEFNDWVDEQQGPIRILESEFRASEVLFQMEPESYRIHLAEFELAESAGAESGATPKEAT